MIKPRALTSLSIFFPCYNESENVDSMIEQAVGVGESYGVDYEIVVVDDGSRDATPERVKRHAERNPRIRLIRHETNRGYGAALRTGFSSVTKDLVLFADGDNQFRLADVDKLFSKIDSCDAVAGFRIQRRDKAIRRVNGRLWTALTRLLLRLPVRDVDCGFKLYKRKCLEGLKLESDQLLIHAEMLAKVRKKGCRIEEIGIPHYPRPAGKPSATHPLRVFKTFGELLRLLRKPL